MSQLSPRRSQIVHCAVFGIGFLAIAALCLLFPITGDDWFYENKVASFPELIHRTGSLYTSMSGRVLAHVLAIGLGTHRVLRALFRAVVVWLISYHAYRLIQPRSLWIYPVILVAFVALPASIFAQTMAWSVGFCNYVPQMLLILLFLRCCGDIFHETPMLSPRLRSLASFVFCFSAQLFAEHTTIMLVFLALFMMCFSRFTSKRWHLSACSGFCGAVLGAIVMFASPAYSSQDGSYYRFGFSKLLDTILFNYTTISYYTIAGNCVILLVLTALVVYTLYASGKYRRLSQILSSVVIVDCLFFIFFRLVLKDNLDINDSIFAKKIDIVVFFTWMVCVSFALFCMDDPAHRLKLFTLWGSAILCAAPMFIVSPCGPRCLYGSYFLLILLAIQWSVYLLSPYAEHIYPLRYAAVTAAVFLFGVYLFMFTKVYAQEQNQYRMIQEEMALGHTEIYLPELPYTQYIHGDNSDFYFSMVFNYGDPEEMQFYFYR